MKTKDVKIGGVYKANVSGKLCDVRLDSEHPGSGWNATNLATGKKIHIRSVRRLQREVKSTTAKATKTTKTEAANQPPVDTHDAALQCPRGGEHEWQEDAGEVVCGKCLEPQVAAKPKRQRKAKASTTDGGGEKKLSQIAAAALVLAEAPEPMGAKEMVEAMVTRGLWTSPGGKTPEATLYAAIMREINAKGTEARFAKADRGKFVANVQGAIA